MKDTFGMALLDYFDNPEGTHILERDDGYINIIKTSTYFDEFKDWLMVEQELSNYVKGRVLDVGCGSGRSVKYFQEQGLDAIGIDISPKAIEASRRFGVKNCVVMDAMSMDFPVDSFDTVVLFGNGLGLCGLESKSMLEHLHNIIKSEGLLLASSRDPKKTNNPIHLEYHERNRRQGKPIGLLNLRVNYVNVKGEWFDFYMLEPNEIEEFIHGTGWKLETTIDIGNPNYGVVLRNSA